MAEQKATTTTVRRSMSDRRDARVSVTRSAPKKTTTTKVSGQKVEATMKALMEASEKKRKPTRTINSNGSSPTCENPDLKEELMMLRKQGLASGRSNSSSSINSTSSVEGSKRSPVNKRNTLPSQQSSSVTKKSTGQRNGPKRLSHPTFKPPEAPGVRRPP